MDLKSFLIWYLFAKHIYKSRTLDRVLFCTKILVTIRSSLLVIITYQFTKHYNYLQAYLHNLQTQNINKVIKNAVMEAWCSLFVHVTWA
jgi:hypothetical protein